MAPRPLRVLYNASAVPETKAGAGVYTLELGRALASRESLAMTVLSPRPTGFGQQVRTPSATFLRLPWESFCLSRTEVAQDADVYHGPHFFTPRLRIPSVATIHDLTFFRIRRRYGPAHLAYYRYLARTASRANRIIVPSSAVAADCVRFLGAAPEHIRVVAEAPRQGLAPSSESAVDAFRARYGIRGRYFACLGTAEPGKRAVDAVRALPAIQEHHPDVRLVLAGNPGPLSGALGAEAHRLGVSEAVTFTGYLPDTALAPFLSGAVALIFPSLYEGFGLPPLEALACGTPVIASDAPAMNEVLAAGTVFVSRRDPAAIARAAATLLTGSRRQDLAAEGSAFAAGFSWERAAAETEAVYREVAS